jgi:glycosyltransferase involved in cell wall biosynthesis
MRRLKILVSAYACSPRQGSEPGMAWGWVMALSQHHDLWVISDERYMNEIEDELNERRDLRRRMHFFYIPRKRHMRLEKISQLAYYRTYKKWQKEAFELGRSLHDRIGFDLVHQLNMIGFREPGYLWKLNAPFVWGPVGGTADVPLRFASILGPREFLYHLARNTINACQLRHLKRVRAALARADGFVTATSDTQEAFLRVAGRNSTVIGATGTHAREGNVDSGFEKVFKPPFNLVWSGVHVSRKALPIALKALKLVTPDCSWHLDILGSGSMTPRWRRLAKRLGVDKHCTWHGWLSHSEAEPIMRKAYLFIFPSLQEGSPTVVMEALASGVPVVCLDHCGMADVVNEECGVKVPVTTPGEVISNFALAIERLIKNPEERARLSRGALEQAPRHSWKEHAERMLEVYEKAVEHWRRGNCQRRESLFSETPEEKHEYMYTE